MPRLSCLSCRKVAPQPGFYIANSKAKRTCVTKEKLYANWTYAIEKKKEKKLKLLGEYTERKI